MTYRIGSIFYLRLVLPIALLFLLPSTTAAEEFLVCKRPTPEWRHDGRTWDQRTSSILHRLSGDEVSTCMRNVPHLVITADPLPNAYLRTSNEIVLSGGLLQVIEDPSELAFVIAHELGHLQLGHLTSIHPDSSGETIERELAADRYAQQLLRQSGFSPGAPRTLLSRLSRWGQDQGDALFFSQVLLRQRLEGLDGASAGESSQS